MSEETNPIASKHEEVMDEPLLTQEIGAAPDAQQSQDEQQPKPANNKARRLWEIARRVLGVGLVGATLVGGAELVDQQWNNGAVTDKLREAIVVHNDPRFFTEAQLPNHEVIRHEKIVVPVECQNYDDDAPLCTESTRTVEVDLTVYKTEKGNIVRLVFPKGAIDGANTLEFWSGYQIRNAKGESVGETGFMREVKGEDFATLTDENGTSLFLHDGALSPTEGALVARKNVVNVGEVPRLTPPGQDSAEPKYAHIHFMNRQTKDGGETGVERVMVNFDVNQLRKLGLKMPVVEDRQSKLKASGLITEKEARRQDQINAQSRRGNPYPQGPHNRHR